MPADSHAAGDPIPPGGHVIEVRVNELRQLFNAIDPSPFHERDLDPRAEEFIVEWSRDYPNDAALALVVHPERAAGQPDEAVVLRDAIHEFFKRRAATTRRTLRELFRRGRTSLIIGLAFLSASVALGDTVAAAYEGSRVAGLVREGLLIGGWVAMWRPIEIFLYDWWPIRGEIRLYDRLSSMPVRIEYQETQGTETRRSEGPAVAGDFQGLRRSGS